MTFRHTHAPLLLMIACGPNVVACTTTAPPTAYTPITGIQISATDVVMGHGCGARPSQVYKYAVVVSYAADGGAPGAPLTSGVFDCFTDGLFSNLPVNDGGSQLFDVAIYAYNQASFPRALDCPPNAAPCPSDEAGSVQPWEATANWSGKCTATEFQGATTLATCGLLSSLGAGSLQGDAMSE